MHVHIGVKEFNNDGALSKHIASGVHNEEAHKYVSCRWDGKKDRGGGLSLKREWIGTLVLYVCTYMHIHVIYVQRIYFHVKYKYI